MEHHFERTMTLNTKSKYENLYQWSITEAESDGKNTIDVIPWEWRLNYTATECYLSDALTLSLGFAFKKEDREASLDERQTIRIKLRPGHTQADGDTSHATRHSMFGTSRTVEDICSVYIATPTRTAKTYARRGGASPTRWK